LQTGSLSARWDVEVTRQGEKLHETLKVKLSTRWLWGFEDVGRPLKKGLGRYQCAVGVPNGDHREAEGHGMSNHVLRADEIGSARASYNSTLDTTLKKVRQPGRSMGGLKTERE
jgi:hypothetical protein